MTAPAPSTLVKDFPPGWGHIKVPVSSRRAALAGLTLYTGCRPAGLWAQRVAASCVALLGPRALPGRSMAWLPLPEGDWMELAAGWRQTLGAFDDVAGYSRLDSRPGAALLLLRRGVPLAFVKLRRDDPVSLANEHRALTAVWKSRPHSFRVPEPIAWGTAAGWRFLACAPMGAGRHRPALRPPLQTIGEEIEAALGDQLRPAETPKHWRPMHGDFTPWNLRQLGRRDLVLIDWEEAGWGPPDADRVYYHAACAALGQPPWGARAGAETVSFWRARLPSEPAAPRDARLRQAIDQALSRMVI